MNEKVKKRVRRKTELKGRKQAKLKEKWMNKDNVGKKEKNESEKEK